MFLSTVVGQLVRMGFFGSFSGLRLVVKDLTLFVWFVVYFLTAIAFYQAGKVGKGRELSFDFSRLYKLVFLVGPLLVLLNL